MLPHFILKNHFSEYEDLILSYGGKIEKIQRGTILHNANNEVPDQTSYYIRSGIAKLTLIKEDGSENICFFYGEGSMYPVDWRDFSFSLEKFLHLAAVTDLEVISFPSRILNTILDNDHGFAKAAVSHYTHYVNTLLTKLLLGSYNNSLVCVSSFIYLYYNKSTPSFYLTQEQIASITGLSRTQVTRVLTTLRSEGIIETQRNKIRILDLEKLEGYCCTLIHDGGTDK